MAAKRKTRRKAPKSGGTEDHPERRRVMLKDAQTLADRLTVAGSKATVQHNGTAVYGWNQNDTFACAFYWVSGKGWRFDVAQPCIYTHADVDFALDELDRSQQAAKAVTKSWEAYKSKRTERRWQSYQGTLAAHNFRQIGGTCDK